MRTSLVAMFAATIAMPALAQTQAGAPANYRGVIEAVSPGHVKLYERSGDHLDFTIAPDARYSLVVPIALDAIKPGAYVGSTTLTQKDGTEIALEVHVFPENQRGTGEGTRPYDLKPESIMTNGTVGDVSGIKGRTMVVDYKSGKRVITVPDDTPVVTSLPGDASNLVPGAKAVLSATKDAAGNLTAVRVQVGKDGLMPPT